MLSALLFAGLFAEPVARVALFMPNTRRPPRDEQRSHRLARFVLAAGLIGDPDRRGRRDSVIDRSRRRSHRGGGDWARDHRPGMASGHAPVNAPTHVCSATTTYAFAVYRG